MNPGRKRHRIAKCLFLRPGCRTFAHRSREPAWRRRACFQAAADEFGVDTYGNNSGGG